MDHNVVAINCNVTDSCFKDIQILKNSKTVESNKIKNILPNYKYYMKV